MVLWINSRKDKRFLTEGAAWVRPSVGTWASEILDGILLDIGAGGMGCLLKQKLDQHITVEVMTDMGGSKLVAIGTVRWTSEDPNGYRTGIQFEKFTVGSRTDIQRFTAGLPG